MSSVYDPARHEAVTGAEWSSRDVADEIVRIVTDFEAALGADGGWPSHPLDWPTREPRWALYAGAAGAVVSLRILCRAGYGTIDPSPLLPRIHAAYLDHPDEGYETGLQLGEIGILTPAILAGLADAALSDRLRRCLGRTLGHKARETTSGEAGMMHAALTLFRETGDEVWKDLYCRAAKSLWQAWTPRPETGEWLWTSDIFGSVRSYYGACHGVAGNAHAFLRGADLLASDRAELIVDRVAGTLDHAALRDGADINWPVSGDPSGARRLVQWCHGAPGVVTALGRTPRIDSAGSALLDRLLLQAGEFVWKAGPPVKGPGVCHGSAGSGYAFLALYHRTGEEIWLARARRFAMHAIEQCRHSRERFGQGRYTLWTGDGGLAVYLHHCLAPGHAAFPGLELF